MTREEIMKIMKEFEERETIGPDGVLECILNKCKQEMAVL